jgi:putative mRNA 3-end processing factor
MPVELKKAGLHLTGTPLWLDARRKSELSFVSHAHSDHIARHERVISTSTTLALLQARLGEVKAALPAPYRRPFELGPLILELFPAGHVLGSAQLRITRPDGRRIVYSGDVNLQSGLTAEPLEVAECDTLILESTFGHPRFRLPPREETLADVEKWVHRQFGYGRTPILYAYPLGKAQETIAFLEGKGLPVVCHPSTFAVCEVYRAHGVKLAARKFDGTIRPGEVGMFPPFGKSQALKALPRRSTAVLTGWAMEPNTAARYGADVAFPLSDHADFDGLCKYAEQTGAEEVITHHGFAEDLATALRGRGMVARAVKRALQLQFSFDGLPATPEVIPLSRSASSRVRAASGR